MPFFAEQEPGFRPNVTQEMAPPPTGDLIGAAFRQDNVVVSLLNQRANSGPFEPEPGHNPLNTIRGTPYEASHLDRFVGSRSEAETRAIMGEIDREDSDRRVLDAAGFGGTLLQMLAGTLDPTILLPAGAVVKAGREGYSLGRSAVSVGAAAALQAATQETILQSTQETRPLAESALAVGSATVLGSLLGAGAARLLSSVDRTALSKVLDAERVKIDAHASGRPASNEAANLNTPDAANTRGTGEALAPEAIARATANENRMAGDTPVGAAAGAAATDTRKLELAPALGVEKLTAGFDPMSRLLNAESTVARRTAADLAETPLMFKDNFAGVATTQGATLEREARLAINSTRVNTADELDRLFSEYRFGSPDVTVPRMRAQFERLMGRDGEYMTFTDFKREVAKALQEGDRHDIPQVEQAAQYVRRTVFNPWRDRAIKAGLLPEDVGVKTAESFFQRVYDKQKIGAQRPQFVDTVANWLRSDQSEKAVQKDRLTSHADMLNHWDERARNWQARLDRLGAAQERVGARLDERAMEVARAEKRTGVVNERATSVAEELSDIAKFIAEMRKEVRDPALLDRLSTMEKEAAQLRAAERPVTEASLRQVEDEELKSILTGKTRLAAQMVVGQRSYPKAPSFISWLVSNGGIKDTGGDIAHIMGGGRSRPGLLNSAKGNTLDEIASRISEQNPGRFQHDLPSHTQIHDWIDEALRGREPDWWVEAHSPETKDKIEAGQMAAALEETFSRAGIEVKNISDVAKVFRDESVGAGRVTLEDLDKIAADMEAAGESVPISIRRKGVQDQIDVTRGTITELRGLIQKGIAARDAKTVRLRIAEGRGAEAGLAERSNRGRLGVLQDRLDRGEMRRELMADAIDMAKRQSDDIRGRIEEIIGSWEGKSAQEAKSALKAREKYIAEATAAGKTSGENGRLTGADSAIDTAVRRIINSDRDLGPDELRSKAHEITDRILSSPDGRLPYDIASGGPKIGVGGDNARGSLASRDFNIPDASIRPWLDQDVERVVGLHLRTMVPDVLMTERFGDVDLNMPIRNVNEEYAAKIDAAPSEKARTKLEKERQTAIADIAAIRDRLRGTYGYSSDTFLRSAARTAAAIKNYNVLANMGSAVAASLSDIAGPIFRNSLTTTFRDGWTPFFKALTGDGEAWSAAKRQYRAMGIVTETAIASRHHALDDITDLYRPESRLERTMQWGADKFQLVNLLAPWTDWGKTTASVIGGAEILRAAEAAVNGKITQRQLQNLAASGIDRQMADRIWRQFDPAGQIKAGAIQDGVYLPNTGDWKDIQARNAFEAAVAREADIAIVTPGQEKPLWMSQPLMSVLGQFKSFTAASTQRVLIANLQRRDAAALQGLLFSAGLGMMSYKLNSVFSGNPVSDRPQDWIKEGISRSGMLGWLEEGNALASKMSRGGVDVYRLIGADKPLSRFASRSVLDQLLGPTAGKIEALSKVTGAGLSRDWLPSDSHALRRLTAFQNLFYVRRLFDAAETGLNGALGVE